MRSFLPISLAVLAFCTFNSSECTNDFSQYNVQYGRLNYLSNKESFNSIKDNADQVFFVFSASWCGPCQQLAPILEELATEFPDLLFVKVDIQSFPNITSSFGILSIPTIIIFENGKQILRDTGFNGKSYWTSKIKSLLDL